MLCFSNWSLDFGSCWGKVIIQVNQPHIYLLLHLLLSVVAALCAPYRSVKMFFSFVLSSLPTARQSPSPKLEPSSTKSAEEKPQNNVNTNTSIFQEELRASDGSADLPGSLDIVQPSPEHSRIIES